MSKLPVRLGRRTLRTGSDDLTRPPALTPSQTVASVDPEPAPHVLPGRPLPAVVVNPSHVNDLAMLHTTIAKVCAELGWAPPLWLPTTVEDPGGGQTRIALDASAAVVLVCGGDGTIRHVAHVLAGSGIPLGLLPTGTANLLARNLAMVLKDTVKATRIALSGRSRAIDVGRVLIDNRDEEQVFLVMAGMGFDAAIMAGAPHELKSRLGPLAYFVSGVRALRAPGAPITLVVDGRPELPRQVRTVVVGNCGRLLAGLVLLPAAKVDDGLLDVVSLGPKNIRGWLAVTALLPKEPRWPRSSATTLLGPGLRQRFTDRHVVAGRLPLAALSAARE